MILYTSSYFSVSTSKESGAALLQFAQHPPFSPGLRSIEKQVGLSCGSYEVVIVEDWLFACCTFDGFIHPNCLAKDFALRTSCMRRAVLDCVEYPWNPHRMLQKIAPKQSCIALLKRDLTHLGWRGRLTETYCNDYWRGTERPKKRMFLSHDALSGGSWRFLVANIFHLELGAGDVIYHLQTHFVGYRCTEMETMIWIEYERINVATILYSHPL